MEVTFSPVTKDSVDIYVNVGVQSYNEHYLHLWQNRDASAFIAENLTRSVVEQTINHPNQYNYIIMADNCPVGILKLTLDEKKGSVISPKNVLLNKIYLLGEYSGIGIGKIANRFVENFVRSKNRTWLWLYTMKRGAAQKFYINNGYKIVGESEVDLPNILESEKEMWIMAKKVEVTTPLAQ